MKPIIVLFACLWLTLSQAVALPTCTIDPATKSANIALSGGNNTWTSTGAGGSGDGAHGTRGYPAGNGIANSPFKYYAEFTVTAVGAGANTFGVGIASAADPVSAYLGNSFNGVGFYNGNHVAQGNLTQTTLFTFTTADIIGMAVDFFNQKIWWTKNGTTWNNDVIGNQNPATNTGGFFPSTIAHGPWGSAGSGYFIVYPAIGSLSSGNVGVFNGGLTSFTYTAPSGYTGWCLGPAPGVGAGFMKSIP